MSAPGWGQSLVSTHQIDLDGDGVKEVVGLRKFERDGVEYGQLVVADQKGRILWEASTKAPEFLFLGEFDKGTLEAAYRQDESAFLIASYQKSDVSPTRFRQFMWHDRGFVHLRNGSLLPAPQRPATFIWKEDPGASRWLEEFKGSNAKGHLRAEITDLGTRSKEEMWLRPDGKEFVLTVE